MVVSRGIPFGVYSLQQCFRLGKYRRVIYQSSVLILTFIAYITFNISRRPLAVVKNSLNQNCSKLTPPPGLILTNETKNNWCDWAPFDNNGDRLLGLLDSVFVFAYAVCMFVSGMIAERIDLRYFLTLGMLASGLFTYMFGIAYYLDIHSLSFFIVAQFLSGAAQCTGWPGVVTCVGNWFGKNRRGLIFGIWNAHTYVGNIVGAYIAGYFVVHNWGLSFIVPGAIIGVVGFILFLFLVPYPEDVDCCPSNNHGEEFESTEIFNASLSGSGKYQIATSPQNGNCTDYSPSERRPEQEAPKQDESRAITFLEAVRIPGVVEFSSCLFFSKLVCYTFLFWLPRYISHATGAGSQSSAYRSTAFDVGGMIGGIIAGLISDHTGSSALTCIGFLTLAIPSLFTFGVYGGASDVSIIVFQLVCGALVNGPYSLITTAVSVELATNKDIKSDSKATVTAIIDGFGSVGAAVGPLVAGIASDYSWSYVFFIMMLADFLALVSLFRIAVKEFKLCFELKDSFPFIRRKFSGPYEQIG